MFTAYSISSFHKINVSSSVFSLRAWVLWRSVCSPWWTATTCLPPSLSWRTKTLWCGSSAGLTSTPSSPCSSTWCCRSSSPSSLTPTRPSRYLKSSYVMKASSVTENSICHSIPFAVWVVTSGISCYEHIRKLICSCIDAFCKQILGSFKATSKPFNVTKCVGTEMLWGPLLTCFFHVVLS